MIDTGKHIDIRSIVKLNSIDRPGKQLRNILIVFLTLFHEDLVDLISDSQDTIEDNDDDDPEWSTIRSFFKSEIQIVSLIKNAGKIVERRGISDEYLKKGAAILEVKNNNVRPIMLLERALR
jgi:hypothetical protein